MSLLQPRRRGIKSAIEELAQVRKQTVTGDDPDTLRIANSLNDSLKATKCYELLASLDSPEFSWQDIRRLGENGLDPARYRARDYEPLKACFRRKLLPEDRSRRCKACWAERSRRRYLKDRARVPEQWRAYYAAHRGDLRGEESLASGEPRILPRILPPQQREAARIRTQVS